MPNGQNPLQIVSYFENTKELRRVSCIYDVRGIYGHLLYRAKPDISTGTELVTHSLGFGYKRFLKMKTDLASDTSSMYFIDIIYNTLCTSERETKAEGVRE
jgi:hypothetical protein